MISKRNASNLYRVTAKGQKRMSKHFIDNMPFYENFQSVILNDGDV